jgi:hypothetical protein
VANLLFNNENSGLAIGGYDNNTSGQVLNSSFSNNTNMDGSGEIYITKASNCLIENNIVFTNSQNILFTLVSILPQNNNQLNYNCWCTASSNAAAAQVNWLNHAYAGYSNYINATKQDKNSIFANPLFSKASLPDPGQFTCLILIA